MFYLSPTKDLNLYSLSIDRVIKLKNKLIICRRKKSSKITENQIVSSYFKTTGKN